MPAPRLLLIDNYDSFTYNLVQAFMVLGAEVLVHRNDAITVGEAAASGCVGAPPGAAELSHGRQTASTIAATTTSTSSRSTRRRRRYTAGESRRGRGVSVMPPG